MLLIPIVEYFSKDILIRSASTKVTGLELSLLIKLLNVSFCSMYKL